MLSCNVTVTLLEQRSVLFVVKWCYKNRFEYTVPQFSLSSAVNLCTICEALITLETSTALSPLYFPDLTQPKLPNL